MGVGYLGDGAMGELIGYFILALFLTALVAYDLGRRSGIVQGIRQTLVDIKRISNAKH